MTALNTAPVKKRREYSPTEIQQALTVLTYYGGNAARASKETSIPQATLKLWRTQTHREQYLEIAEREGPRLEALAAAQAREILLRAGQVEHSVLDRLDQDEDLTTKEVSELAGALQRVTTTKGINTDKLLLLTGRPTEHVQHLSPRDTMLSMARDLGIVVDGTADEAPTELPQETA